MLTIPYDRWSSPSVRSSWKCGNASERSFGKSREIARRLENIKDVSLFVALKFDVMSVCESMRLRSSNEGQVGK